MNEPDSILGMKHDYETQLDVILIINRKLNFGPYYSQDDNLFSIFLYLFVWRSCCSVVMCKYISAALIDVTLF